MNAKERERNEQWLRRMAALEGDCGDYAVGEVPLLARRFPVPDTSGLTPAEAETVLEKWRAEVHAAMAQTEQPQAEPSGTTSPAQPRATPEAPVA